MITENKIFIKAKEIARLNQNNYDSQSVYIFEDGFKSGIEWFRDNLWHDIQEEPRTDFWILLKCGDVCPIYKTITFTDNSNYIDIFIKNEVNQWLYINDLFKVSNYWFE